jgi:MFS transporter, DHA2 family, multidrug resistance protein
VPQAPPSEISGRARTFALTATSIGTLVATLQGSITNTALPSIARDFGISPADSIWVVNGYQLTTTATLLAFAALCDSLGARRLFQVGLLIFTLASLACALAPSFAFLIAMRVMQGIGASMMIVSTQTLNRAVFPHAQLGRAIAVNAMFVAVGTAAGPSIGGVILAVGSWHEIFWFNIPLGMIGVLLGWRYLPRVIGTGAPLDRISAVLAAIGFGGSVYGVDAIAHHMPSLGILGILAGAALAITIFVRRQLGLQHSLLAVELFRDPVFSVACVASWFTYTAQGLTYVILPFFFQLTLGYTPLQSGLLISSWPLTALLVASRMGRISDRYPAAILCTIGIVLMGVGIIGFTILPAQPAWWSIVLCATLGGAGFATFQTPNNRAMIAIAPPEKTGRASGVMSMARLYGQTGGAALVAIVFGLMGIVASEGVRLGRAPIEVALFVGCVFIALAAMFSTIRLNATRSSATHAKSS